MLCQTLVYREVTALFSLKASDIKASASEDIKDPWSKILNWYFFAVTNYFLYGESIIYYFKVLSLADLWLTVSHLHFYSMWFSPMRNCSPSPPITE